MKTKDILTVAAVAAVTATLTVAAFWAKPLEAGNEELAAKIAQPKLVANGIELTLAAAKGQTCKAGEEPVFELKAVNPGCEPATVSVRISMTADGPANLLSRLPTRPASLWQETQTLALQGGETKTVTLATRTKLPAQSVIAVTLGQTAQPGMAAADLLPTEFQPQSRVPAGLGITALSFSTLVASNQPALASAK